MPDLDRRITPFGEIFATARSTQSALDRLGGILAGGNAAPEDLRLLMAGLVINPEQFPKLDGKSLFDAYRVYIDRFTDLLLNGNHREAKHAIRTLGQALRHELLLGWINLDKQTEVHHAIVAFRRLHERPDFRSAVRAELIDTVLCHNPLLPIDVRGEAADLLVHLYDPVDFMVMLDRCRSVVAKFRPFLPRDVREHVLIGTDTVETPLTFPRTTTGRIRALWQAAVAKTHERVFVDVMRVSEQLGQRDARFNAMVRRYKLRLNQIYELNGEYLSHPEAEEFITARLTSRTRQLEDYIVNPNQKLGPYTVSDLSRLMSLSPECFWPDRQVRTAWTAFARAVLGFCRVANIGLGAKMVYIPHGVDIPSLVYVGQATVVGKGVNIDMTGGVVIGRRNYTSAFWSDTDLHGHLHVGDDQRGVGGTISRLRIEPYIMILDDDIAFPAGSGYVEAALYAPGEKKFDTIPGFRVVPASAKPLRLAS